MKIVIQCGNPNNLIWVSPTTFYFPERYILHPKLHVEWIEILLRDIEIKKRYVIDYYQDDTIFIVTNSEHILNRCRVAIKEKELEELEIHFSPFENNKKVRIIRVDKKGELEEYPKDFLDEWSNQLMKLL